MTTRYFRCTFVFEAACAEWLSCTLDQVVISHAVNGAALTQELEQPLYHWANKAVGVFRFCVNIEAHPCTSSCVFAVLIYHHQPCELALLNDHYRRKQGKTNLAMAYLHSTKVQNLLRHMQVWCDNVPFQCQHDIWAPLQMQRQAARDQTVPHTLLVCLSIQKIEQNLLFCHELQTGSSGISRKTRWMQNL